MGCPYMESLDIYEIIYSYCNANQNVLKKYKKCTCLYCGSSFDYSCIKAWVNDQNGKTAICPYCSIDSVVPTKVENGIDKYIVTDEIQKKIKKIYYGG